MQEDNNKKQKTKSKMTKPIVTAQEKKANATRYCTSPRPQRLKAARKRDFNDLVKSCIKVGMSKPRAIEHATAAFNANAFAEPPAKRFLWGYSPTSPRPEL